jgi:small conductance mechanosensitive channel
MDKFASIDFAAFVPKMQELVVFYGLKIIGAIAIFVVGRWFAMAMKKTVKRLMVKSNVDAMLIPFVGSMTYITLLAIVVIAALNQLNIQTTSFIAILGAAGLAIGLALQGSLSNFAAGVLMVLFRPFKVGDYIEGAGVSGSVAEIQFFTTVLNSPSNTMIIVPNAKMMSDNITNYSANKNRRVDLVYQVSYGDDLDKVRRVLAEIIAGESRVLKEPELTIAVLALADSSVNFAVRPWVKSEDYWGVYFALNETIKKRFDAEGISIPFPQRDIHIYAEKSVPAA